VGLAGSPVLGATEKSLGKARVVEVMHPKVVAADRKINQSVVEKMLAKGMQALTRAKKPWIKFIKPTDVVGLKINCLGRPLLSTHRELVEAVSRKLVSMGVAENNIIVWDRFGQHMVDAKYPINTSKTGVRYCGAEGNADKIVRYDKKMAHVSSKDNPKRRSGDHGTHSPYASIFTKECDKIINLAVLKDHVLAGVTLCLKNMAFGLTGNNSRFHGREHIGSFIADVCEHPMVKEKVVLHIIDGLEGCFDNGPVPKGRDVMFAPQTLWLSEDPVAIDAIACEVIEAKRKQKGLASMLRSGRPADHILISAQRGLGVADPKQIKLDRISFRS
jgi:uncharacterized protein (DUF362 family)